MTKPADLTTSDDRLFAAAAFLEPVCCELEDRLMNEAVVTVRPDAPLDLLAVTTAARANYAADLLRYFYDRVDHAETPEVSLALPALETAAKLALELATRLADPRRTGEGAGTTGPAEPSSDNAA